MTKQRRSKIFTTIQHYIQKATGVGELDVCDAMIQNATSILERDEYALLLEYHAAREKEAYQTPIHKHMNLKGQEKIKRDIEKYYIKGTGEQQKSLKEIAAIHNISYSQICQLSLAVSHEMMDRYKFKRPKTQS